MVQAQQKQDAISTWCGAVPARMTGFVQPWILLILTEAPAHGYQLAERLRDHPDTASIDTGFLYRTLRQFEKDSIVRSTWDVGTPGPARRVYEITPAGVEYLHAWAEHIHGARERLGRLLQAYDAYCQITGTQE